MTGQRGTHTIQAVKRIYLDRVFFFFLKSVKLIRIEICAPVSSHGMLF